MLFIFDIIKNKLAGCKIFALEKGRVTSQSKLYCFPFGNVGPNGTVCFGANKLPVFKGLSELETFFRFVLALEHNDDLYTGNKTQRELIEELAQKNEFDDSVLQECGTLDSII